MASQTSHIRLANRNQAAIDCLINADDEHPEWIATVAFYKAVHLVEAVLAAAGFHSESHGIRLAKTKSTSLPKHTHKHFRPLWQASTIARYLYDADTNTSYKQFTDYLPASDVVEKLVHRRLKPLEDLLIGQLGESNRQALVRVE